MITNLTRDGVSYLEENNTKFDIIVQIIKQREIKSDKEDRKNKYYLYFSNFSPCLLFFSYLE